MVEVLRYVAFSDDPLGGNPAGVVLDAAGLDVPTMQQVAAQVGYSETAFLAARDDGGFDVRYFSPLIEVPFCGHATIATAVAYAQRFGTGDLALRTAAGPIPVVTRAAADGSVTATLTSPPTRTAPIADDDLARLLDALGWAAGDLDPALPVRAAFAGGWHPVVAARSRERLAALDYDTARLAALMAERDWATIDLVWREDPQTYHARNPFPPGGVVEDPATGAAAAAFGGYLRELGLIAVPTTLTVFQGHDMGRPSTILVEVPAAAGSGVRVTGTAVAL